MSETAGFTVAGAHHPYLFRGETELDAVVTVGFTPGEDTTCENAEVIVIDRSASMLGRKLAEAKRAARAALEAIPDGARFALVAGDHEALPLYPADGTLATAADRTRAGAGAAVDTMEPRGTTNTGTWLRLAADVLAARPDAIGHVLLLTDGRLTQPAAALDADLAHCAGKFTCDAVGIGLDWEPAELERIGERLHGGFEYCGDLGDLAAHFTAIAQRSTSRRVDDVELRVFAPSGAELRGLVQVAPFRQDLRSHRRPLGPHAWSFPLGAWGEETREYLLRASFPATEVTKRRGLRVEIAHAGTTAARTLLAVTWTNDRARGLAVHPAVAERLGLVQYAERVREFFDRYRGGDLDAATEALRRAWAIAEDGGHEHHRRGLAEVAYLDPSTGDLALRERIGTDELITLRSESTRPSPPPDPEDTR